MELEWRQIIPAFLLGVVLGGVVGFYFLRKYLEKKTREMSAFMDKENLRQMFEMFGQRPPEQQLNMILKRMEEDKNKRNKKK